MRHGIAAALLLLSTSACTGPIFEFGNDLDDLIEREMHITQVPAAFSHRGNEACFMLHDDGQFRIRLNIEDITRWAKWEVTAEDEIKIIVDDALVPVVVGHIRAASTPDPDAWRITYTGLFNDEFSTVMTLDDYCPF